MNLIPNVNEVNKACNTERKLTLKITPHETNINKNYLLGIKPNSDVKEIFHDGALKKIGEFVYGTKRLNTYKQFKIFTEEDLSTYNIVNTNYIFNDKNCLTNVLDPHWKYIIEIFLSKNYNDMTTLIASFYSEFYKAISEKEYYCWNDENKLWISETVNTFKNVKLGLIIDEIITNIKIILDIEYGKNKDDKNIFNALRRLKDTLEEIPNKLISKYHILTARIMYSVKDEKFRNSLDSNKTEIPVLGQQIVDLKTGGSRIRTHNDRWTREIQVNWNPSVNMTIVQNWINELFLIGIDDKYKGMPEFLQIVLGYGLTGSVDEQAMFLFLGDGSAGKTTLSNYLRDLLGHFYAGFPASMITEHSKSRQYSSASPSPNPFLNHLERVRMAFCTEVDSESVVKIAEMKKMTGNESLNYRLLQENEIRAMRPYFKMFLLCNTLPAIKDENSATWRRIFVLFFPALFVVDPDENDIRQRPINREIENILREKINTEAMLRWLVEGSIKYFKLGNAGINSVAPEIVKTEKKNYQEDGDFIGKFISEKIKVTKNQSDKIEASDLYSTYLEWQEINNSPRYGNVQFGKLISAKNKQLNDDKTKDFNKFPKQWIIKRSNGTKHIGIKIIDKIVNI